MKISFLKTFLVAAETLNISKTAVERGVSQPAISKQIKELEKAVGCNLFNRINNRIHLTEEGKYFIRKAERVVRIYEQGVAELRETKLLGNSVRFGASSTLGVLVVPDMIKEANHTTPEIKVSAEVKTVSELLDALKKNDLDFCLLEGNSHEYNKDFIVKPVCHSELVFITPKGHFPVEKTELDPEDLSNKTIFFREEGESYDQTFCTYAKNHNIPFDKKSNFSSLTAIKKFVERGLGIGCIPKCLISEEDKKTFEHRTIKGHSIKYDFSICLCHEHKLNGPHGKIMDISEGVLKNMSKEMHMTPYN